MTYPEWLLSRFWIMRQEEHERRIARRALPPVDNAATRAKRKYEASAKGKATRALYTCTKERLASKERYRSTSWGAHARTMWYIRDRLATIRARRKMMTEEFIADYGQECAVAFGIGVAS